MSSVWRRAEGRGDELKCKFVRLIHVAPRRAFNWLDILSTLMLIIKIMNWFTFDSDTRLRWSDKKLCNIVQRKSWLALVATRGSISGISNILSQLENTNCAKLRDECYESIARNHFLPHNERFVGVSISIFAKCFNCSSASRSNLIS